MQGSFQNFRGHTYDEYINIYTLYIYRRDSAPTSVTTPKILYQFKKYNQRVNFVFLQTDEGAVSDGSLPESWSSLNDDKSVDAMKKFVSNNVSLFMYNNYISAHFCQLAPVIDLTLLIFFLLLYQKELAALELELQNKMRTLNERQSKIDKMDEELTDLTERQKEISSVSIVILIRVRE